MQALNTFYFKQILSFKDMKYPSSDKKSVLLAVTMSENIVDMKSSYSILEVSG